MTETPKNQPLNSNDSLNYDLGPGADVDTDVVLQDTLPGMEDAQPDIDTTDTNSEAQPQISPEDMAIDREILSRNQSIRIFIKKGITRVANALDSFKTSLVNFGPKGVLMMRKRAKDSAKAALDRKQKKHEAKMSKGHGKIDAWHSKKAEAIQRDRELAQREVDKIAFGALRALRQKKLDRKYGAKEAKLSRKLQRKRSKFENSFGAKRRRAGIDKAQNKLKRRTHAESKAEAPITSRKDKLDSRVKERLSRNEALHQRLIKSSELALARKEIRKRSRAEGARRGEAREIIKQLFGEEEKERVLEGLGRNVAQLNMAERSVQESGQNVSFFEGQISRIERSISSSKDKIESIKVAVKDKKASLEALDEAVSLKEAAVANVSPTLGDGSDNPEFFELHEEINQIKLKRDQLREDIADMEEDLAELPKRVDELESELPDLRSQLKQALETHEADQQKRDEIKSRLDDTTESILGIENKKQGDN